jgi:hypothetical protein
VLTDAGGPVIELTRGDGEGAVRAYFNLSREEAPLPGGATGALLFSSESARYFGGRKDGDPVRDLRPSECVVFGAAA